MSSIIYETINLYNKERGILPYKYIGSDQHNKDNYFGSNKKLLEDIKNLGSHNFKKNVLCEFNNIDNMTLRKMESYLQKCLDVAGNPEYYNKTNNSHKGYVETEEEKIIRLKKLKDARESWWNGLSEEEKYQFKKKNGDRFKQYNSSMKGKTYEEIFGEQKARDKRIKHSGEFNGMSKKIMDNKKNIVFQSIKEAIDFYGFNQYKKPYRKIQEKIKSGDLIYI